MWPRSFPSCSCPEMAWPVTTVLADDLTGACEIAGLAHKRGLDVSVALTAPREGARAELLVVNTETRLASNDTADRVVTQWLREPALRLRAGGLFKKTDSVLRGCVAAELAAILRETGRGRALLVPANPGLGRTIRHGRYFVNGVSLDTTGFARDPHHPARTSSVVELVRGETKIEVHSVDQTSGLADAGILVGDAETREDLETWARRLEPDVLAAGSGAFFDAVLSAHLEPTNSWETTTTQPESPEPLLLISGTTAPAQRALLETAQRNGLPACALRVPFPGGANPVARQVHQYLKSVQRAYVFPTATHESSASVAAAIRTELAAIAQRAVHEDQVKHLVIEGGATAAAIADSLSWRSFRVVHEWSPGIVTMQPDGHPGLQVTLKPGSYPWPNALQSLFFGAQPVRP